MNEFAGVRVLVVAENGYERRLVVDLLRGCRVASIRLEDDAIGGFSAMSIDPADIMVVDAELRPHSGLQLVRELRASDGPGRRAPVVLYTSEVSRAFAETAEAAGVTEVLLKPVSMADLRRSLRDSLYPRSAERLADRVVARAAARTDTPVLQRAGWEQPAVRIDRSVRDAVRRSIAEARAALADGAPNPEALSAAVERALLAGQGADPALRKALVAAHGLAKMDPPHARLLEATLVGALALVCHPERPALREALADAVADAARVTVQRAAR